MNGNNVSGTAHHETSDGRYYEDVQFTGSFEGSTLHYRETAITQQAGSFWCLVEDESLVLSSTNQLTGNWDTPGCNAGTVHLQQVPGSGHPSCSITSLTVAPSGTDVQINGSATCSPGSVRAVRFLVDNSIIYELGAPSATYTWHAGSATGKHTITMLAAGQGDNTWAYQATKSTTIDLGSGPASCSISSLSATQSGTDVQIDGTASCTPGSVRAVRFLVDGSIVYELGAPSATYTWHTSGATGKHTITMLAAALGDNTWANQATKSTSIDLGTGQGAAPSQGTNTPPVTGGQPSQTGSLPTTTSQTTSSSSSTTSGTSSSSSTNRTSGSTGSSTSSSTTRGSKPSTNTGSTGNQGPSTNSQTPPVTVGTGAPAAQNPGSPTIAQAPSPADSSSSSGPAADASNQGAPQADSSASDGTGLLVAGGPIEAKWLALGGAAGILGPVTVAESDAAQSPTHATGRYAAFQNGHIHYSPGYGAHETHGAIDGEYLRQGGSGGDLGFPLSDQYASDGVQRNDFEGGYIVLDGQGAHVGQPTALSQPGESSDGPPPSSLPFDVPYISQLEFRDRTWTGGDNCGPASVAMVAAYAKAMDFFQTDAGVQAGQDFMHSIAIDMRGRMYDGDTDATQWKHALDLQNLSYQELGDWQSIEIDVSEHLPVVVPIYNSLLGDRAPYPIGGTFTPAPAPPSRTNHVVVVTGYDDERVWINDPLAFQGDRPSDGQNWWVGRSDFLRAMAAPYGLAVTSEAEPLQPAPFASPTVLAP